MKDMSRMGFLGSGLERLQQARVSIVGAGGGGSHIAQQLAHIGVGTTGLLDGDDVESSNVSRLVGANYGDVGLKKVAVLAQRLHQLAGVIVPVPHPVQSAQGRRWLGRSDLVFGAVDGMRTRDYIEHVCRASLVPYIDIGLTIVVDDDGWVVGIGGQVFTSTPGGPCLRCANILTDEALARDREEYVAGAPEQQVVSMNGLLASQAVNTGIWILTRYAPAFPPPLHIFYDGLAHELRPNKFLPAHCPHYSLESAGWVVRLPPLRNAS